MAVREKRDKLDEPEAPPKRDGEWGICPECLRESAGTGRGHGEHRMWMPISLR